jgi:[ribosomal protein S5]-alanine N-acetyltransferase
MLLTITTRRLTLRPFETTDAPRVAYLAGDYDVSRMCGRVPHPYSVAAAQGWIGGHLKTASRVNLPFAVTVPIDGLIGSCGIHRAEGEADAWEIGYWFGLLYWGQGYASEAARAVMDWARDQLDAKVFLAGHFEDNPASGRVLRKLGFVRTGSAELFGLARQSTARGERYVWPESASAGSLACENRPH